jgi:hypothetical protein
MMPSAKAKPDPQAIAEIKRLILEKMVMSKNWGHNHIEQKIVPRGLPKLRNESWYHDAKHQLRRDGLLQQYREHGKDMYALNTNRKQEIEKLIGLKVTGSTLLNYIVHYSIS